MAFDKTGAELNRFATGKVGVGGLAVKCVPQADGAGGGAGGGDTNCRLWFTNLVEKTVAYISLDVPCSGAAAAAAAAALPGAPAAFRSPVLLLRDKISCRSDASAKAVVRCSALLALLVHTHTHTHKGCGELLRQLCYKLSLGLALLALLVQKPQAGERCDTSVRAVVSAPDDSGAIGCRASNASKAEHLMAA